MEQCESFMDQKFILILLVYFFLRIGCRINLFDFLDFILYMTFLDINDWGIQEKQNWVQNILFLRVFNLFSNSLHKLGDLWFHILEKQIRHGKIFVVQLFIVFLEFGPPLVFFRFVDQVQSFENFKVVWSHEFNLFLRIEKSLVYKWVEMLVEFYTRSQVRVIESEIFIIESTCRANQVILWKERTLSMRLVFKVKLEKFNEGKELFYLFSLCNIWFYQIWATKVDLLIY